MTSRYGNIQEGHDCTIVNNSKGIYLTTSYREGNSHNNEGILEYRNCNWKERNRSVLNSTVDSQHFQHQSNHNHIQLFLSIQEGNSHTTFDNSISHSNRGGNVTHRIHHPQRRNDEYHLTSHDGNSCTDRFGSNPNNVTVVTDCNSSVGENSRMGSVSVDSNRSDFHDRFSKNKYTAGSCNYIQSRHEHQTSQFNYYNRNIPERNNW